MHVGCCRTCLSSWSGFVSRRGPVPFFGRVLCTACAWVQNDQAVRADATHRAGCCQPPPPAIVHCNRLLRLGGKYAHSQLGSLCWHRLLHLHVPTLGDLPSCLLGWCAFVRRVRACLALPLLQCKGAIKASFLAGASVLLFLLLFRDYYCSETVPPPIGVLALPARAPRPFYAWTQDVAHGRSRFAHDAGRWWSCVGVSISSIVIDTLWRQASPPCTSKQNVWGCFCGVPVCICLP